ncbi:hypothetical protein KAR91_42565 [Candidatus Pacearchaeota archaeon]|nr:hypothetical protein [Candidatus Pacearchaeota archaeon]
MSAVQQNGQREFIISEIEVRPPQGTEIDRIYFSIFIYNGDEQVRFYEYAADDPTWVRFNLEYVDDYRLYSVLGFKDRVCVAEYEGHSRDLEILNIINLRPNN